MGRWERRFCRRHGMLTKLQRAKRDKMVAGWKAGVEDYNAQPYWKRALQHMIRKVKGFAGVKS